MDMKISRRDLLSASSLCFLGGTRAFGLEGNRLGPRARSQGSGTPSERLLQAMGSGRLPLTMTDVPAGSGWNWLVQEARTARFTLIGEEHGVAETAKFSTALFKALRGSGYGRMALELSPPIAEDIEAAARRGGTKGVVEFLKNPDTFTFYNLQEEAEFLADVVQSAPKNERVLFGLDREIFSDRYLISKLEAKVPPQAKSAVTLLKDESTKAWARYGQTGNPDDMFILSADPALVSAVRSAWPNPPREMDSILRTLEGSLAIETAERTGGTWPYMQRRTQWTRENFAAFLKAEMGRRDPAKIMMKFGYSHMIRGANYVNAFDIGAMADEVAALTSDKAFHILVLPSPGSRQAVVGKGRSFGSVATDDFDDYQAGDRRLTRVLANPDATGHEVVDLRALRPMAIRGLESWNSDIVRTIHGYDAAVIWKGAHASAALE